MNKNNEQTPQKEETYKLFPNVDDITEILSLFPFQITSEQDPDIISGYNQLRHYISDVAAEKTKQNKIYSCKYFLIPLRDQLIQYYPIDKQLLSYYLSVYEKLLPIIPESERDTTFINWMVKIFFIDKCKIKKSIRFKYLRFILEIKKTQEEEISFLSKIDNLNAILHFLIFDLLNEPEITKKIWIRRIKQIVLFQLQFKKYNMILYHYLFNLICVILNYNYSLWLFGKSKEKESITPTNTKEESVQEGINPAKIKEYTEETIGLLDILMKALENKPPHMFHKYLLTIMIASRCLGDINMLDDIIKNNELFKLELTLELFDLIGITKELESTIQSFRDSFWDEETITNTILISNFTYEKSKSKYMKKITEFLDKKMFISLNFLNSIEFQKSIMRTVVNIFIRDKTSYSLHKQFLVISFWKALMKVNNSSIEQLFNTIMQPLFCWSEHFTYEWEFIFHFFESKRELFKKNPLYISYIFKLVDMFRNNRYYGNINIFEKHYLQWEDIPNDFECQKLHIDFCFKTQYTMIDNLPLKMKHVSELQLSNDTIEYLINKIGNVYMKGNDKLNEIIIAYYVPLYDIIKKKKELIKFYENGMFVIFNKVNDDNEIFLLEMFTYIRNKINEMSYLPFDFMKRLLNYCCINGQINKLKQVNLTLETLIDCIQNHISDFNSKLFSEYLNGLLSIVKELSYSINNDVNWGYLEQIKNGWIWKINYKGIYDKKEMNEFVIFHQQKLFGLFVSAIIQNKLNNTTYLTLLAYIHNLCSKNPFFFTNINLGEFYNYLLSKISSINVNSNKEEIKYILSIINDLVYIIPNRHCYPVHIVPPYYFITQEFSNKKDIQRKCIETFLSLCLTLLDELKKAIPSKIDKIIIEPNYNDDLINCDDIGEITSNTNTNIPTKETPSEDNLIDPKWKLFTKLLDCISFQLHSFFNYGSYNDKDKFKYMSNRYTLFKYLQSKQEVKSTSMIEQEIRVILDTLIQKLFNPLRDILSTEKTIHVNLVSFSLYKLFYHNLELFSIFNDISMQIIYYLISFSWSNYLNEFTFKFTNSFPEVRKLTSIKTTFYAEPNLYIRNQFNLLLCSFIELSPNGEKLHDIFKNILLKNITDVKKTLQTIIYLFLDILEWDVAIKRRRDNYYDLDAYHKNEFFDTPSEEIGFKVSGNKIVNTTINDNNNSNFDVLICSPFSNLQMHFKSLSFENKSEDNYRSFSILDKYINSSEMYDLDNYQDNYNCFNPPFLDDKVSNTKPQHEMGCNINLPGHISNKGYQLQFLYSSEMNMLQLNDIPSQLESTKLTYALNECPINFCCSVKMFYSCLTTNNTSYTNHFLSFLSSFTGLTINELKQQLNKDLYMTIPSYDNKICLTVYNSIDSLEKAQKNKSHIMKSLSQLENFVSLIWIEHLNNIKIPSYVIENEKLFNINIYAFNSHYFTIETNVNHNHPYYSSIIDNFNMLFENVHIFNSNETYISITNFLIKHIQLLCTLVIDKQLFNKVKARLGNLSNKPYITSLYLPKEDNVYFRYKLITNK